MAQKEAYHNYFFEALKEWRIAIIFILLFYTLLCTFAAYPLTDVKTIDTYIETRTKKFKKALKGFMKYGIISVCLGCLLIPFTQPKITKAYDITVETLEQMEDLELSNLDLKTLSQDDKENIKETLIKQMENVDKCTYYLEDVVVLVDILYGVILLFGLASLINLILAIEIFIFTYTNDKYKKFVQVL